MRIFIQIIILSSLVFWGCNDTSNEPQSNNNEYVKGDVSFLLKTTVDFQEMIDAVFPLGEINAIKINLYESSGAFPQDSLQYLKSIFAQYPFIDTTLTSIKFVNEENHWEFFLWIRDFKENNIPDWSTLKNQLNMIPLSNLKAYGLFKIEEGKESYWINLLKNTNLFEWVDYN